MTDYPRIMTTQVKPEWIDYNKHMGDFAYAIAFTLAADELIEMAGMGPAYREASGCTMFTLETHIKYNKEKNLGDALHIDAYLFDMDRKRVHVVLAMRDDAGDDCAQCEMMLMHMRRSPDGKAVVAEMPAHAVEALQGLAALQDGLPRPEANFRIGIRRR